jgi:putative hydrolase of the HAD superfamily
MCWTGTRGVGALVLGCEHEAAKDMTVLALDVDGVIVDNYPDGHGEWSDSLLEDLAIDPARLHKEFFDQSWHDVVRGRRGLRESLEPVLRSLNPDVTLDEFLSYWFQKHSLVNFSVIEVVIEWSRRTATRPWLVSNQEPLRAKYIWNQLGFAAYFEGLIYSAELGITKSSVEFFRLAEKRILAGQSARIIYFDDDEANVEVARRASWDAYVYRSVEDLEAALPARLPLRSARLNS